MEIADFQLFDSMEEQQEFHAKEIAKRNPVEHLAYALINIKRIYADRLNDIGNHKTTFRIGEE
jgi:hypothetical protein